MPRVVVVTAHDPRWESQFHQESVCLRSALGNAITGCHHIGSTAVPGLAAKPVIDILLEVNNLRELDLHAGALARLGYEGLGENGIPQRRFYQKGGDDRTHHIHAFLAGSPDVCRHLCVRDYLKAHADDALAYSMLKQELASRFPNDIDGYITGKAPFVHDLEKKALRWQSAFLPP